MRDLSSMTISEAGEYLSGLRADLEEVEEERMFVLSQTGLHVSAGAVKKFEAEITELKARIEEVEQGVLWASAPSLHPLPFQLHLEYRCCSRC